MRVSTIAFTIFSSSPNVTLAARAFGGLYKKYSDMTTFETESLVLVDRIRFEGIKRARFMAIIGYHLILSPVIILVMP